MKKLTKVLILSMFCLILVNPALAKEEQEGKDSKEVPKNWENPIADTKDYDEYMDKINAITKKDTCYDLMRARMDLFAYEIRYNKANAAVDTEIYSELEDIQTYLQKLRLLVAKQRSKLEQIKGTYEICVQGGKTDFLQDEYTHLKEKLHWVGYEIDSSEQDQVTDDTVESKCSKAESMLSRTEKKIANYEEDMQEIVLAGKIDELYNAKEILNMAKENFAYASILNSKNKDEKKDMAKMRNCMGIISECNIAGELITSAKKFTNGKSEDKSSEIDHLHSKLDLYISILGDKKAYIWTLKNSEAKNEVKSILDEMASKLENIANEMAAIKYDKDYDPDAPEYIKDDFEKIEELLTEYDTALEGTVEGNKSKGQKKNKVNKLIKSARLHAKSLKEKVNKKDEKADSSTEEDVVKFIDQGAAYDAVVARKTAKAYKNEKKYNNALANAYTAIQMSKIGKDVLKESIN